MTDQKILEAKSPLSTKNTILFDLEGTIIDTEVIWDEAGIEFLKRHERVYDRKATKHLLMGGTVTDGAILMRDQYNFEGDAETLGAERREIFEELLRRDISFIPGFEAFYHKVKSNYKLAIATSMEHRFLRDVNKRLNLSQLFADHIYSIEDIGFIPKPMPDIFLYSAAKLGVNPKDCIVIEDSPKGIQAAKAAGMYAIGITTSVSTDTLFQADQIVDAFSKIEL